MSNPETTKSKSKACKQARPRQRELKAVFVSDLFTRFESVMLPIYKPSTRHFIETQLSQLGSTFGKRQIAQIKTEMLQTYVTSLRLTPKTIANRMTVFRTVWRSARTWGFATHDPFAGLILPKLVPPDSRCFTLTEVSRIIESAREPYKTLFWLAAETGVRAGEICALLWSDVDFEEKAIVVARSVWKGQVTTPKTRAGVRRMCISLELAGALQRLKSPRTGSVFANASGTQLDPEKVVQRQLKPLLERLGIRAGGLHAFRHFNATMMDKEAVPMKTRQSRLGHSHPQTTLALYTHILNEEDRRTATSLGKHLLRGAAKPQTIAKAAGMYCWWSSTLLVSSHSNQSS